ncbi:hypothetical protein QR680_017259 [Steinernema hermaphroditum]|uniref:Uncharacterized protein n=1 Tax=Steinernema hermaphroditum TaxID=289476 RepID=A0AA39HGB4_9BILA|nr:hypothetical protein QR680_017259 [Steinernema hermaphroditum]
MRALRERAVLRVRKGLPTGTSKWPSKRHGDRTLSRQISPNANIPEQAATSSHLRCVHVGFYLRVRATKRLVHH